MRIDVYAGTLFTSEGRGDRARAPDGDCRGLGSPGLSLVWLALACASIKKDGSRRGVECERGVPRRRLVAESPTPVAASGRPRPIAVGSFSSRHHSGIG